MNRRIFFGLLFGFVVGLIYRSDKKRIPTAWYRTITKGKRSNEIARQIAWDVEWPITDATDTVLDKAVYRNGHIRNN